MAIQEEMAGRDGRVTLTKAGGESAGLAIGLFGGASGYTTGTGYSTTITGSYTKLLLLQPNTSGTTAKDDVSKKWSDNTSTQHQTETRKYWDHTYTSARIEKGAGYPYDYCYTLTLGGVTKGTWYLPTQAQVLVMRANHAVGAADFVNAWNACKTYASEGGSAGTWSLPTQRELDMIWILHLQSLKESDK